MRRLLRWSIHVLMAAVMLLGLTSLVAWPVSYFKSCGIDLFLYSADRSDPSSTLTGVTLGFNSGVGFYQSLAELPDFSAWTSAGEREYFRIRWEESPPYRGDTFTFVRGTSVSMATAPAWCLALVLLPLPSLWFYTTIRRIFTRDLRMQTNLCLHCGYNLTGVESDKCPECGAARPMATVSSQA